MKAQTQMQRCALDLGKLSDDVADSKTVKEFSSERVKRALAMTVAEFLEAGDSSAAAIDKARASKAYGTQLHDLMEQYKTAIRVIEKHDALKVMFQSSQSILAVERAKIGLL